MKVLITSNNHRDYNKVVEVISGKIAVREVGKELSVYTLPNGQLGIVAEGEYKLIKIQD
jgi:hypothetical protein